MGFARQSRLGFVLVHVRFREFTSILPVSASTLHYVFMRCPLYFSEVHSQWIRAQWSQHWNLEVNSTFIHSVHYSFHPSKGRKTPQREKAFFTLKWEKRSQCFISFDRIFNHRTERSARIRRKYIKISYEKEYFADCRVTVPFRHTRISLLNLTSPGVSR